MNLLSKEQIHGVLGRVWAWWKRDFVVLDEPVGPRWWYLICVVLAILEAWWESTAGSGRMVEIIIYRMR